MSYINATIVERFGPTSGPRQERVVEAGFSREGGRLDRLVVTTVANGVTASRAYEPSPALVQPARALLDAVLGASSLRQVTIDHAAGTIDWSDATGGRLGSVAAGSVVPAPVRSVLDAAAALASAAALTTS
jgi:hypothetical protein